ncbi:mechanosensitive ion channel family protein [Ectobacillus ponti]|uniref:Mechanosensitive ion channel family protein n=1 Tax=Ectobacillus ponti TaxID=2961894 RepID=A0AA41X8R3_9BACI|nr:mechanosensitive ion channel family protein [Ectobacillus ponti]MCP8967471.1 mechanosensitive ion channel family protein [Ectobacillus ponti]
MDLQSWFSQHVFSQAKLATLGGVILKIIFIFLIARMFLYFAKLAIEKTFIIRSKTPMRYSERREATLAKLCQNILTYTVYFVAMAMALEAMGIHIAALLAGVSIAGLAVGFGAQNLVKDVVTGFFIIFEDQFSVGDQVKINDIAGTVEEVGLRTTRIKAVDGEIYFFPNSMITKVANYTLGGRELPPKEESAGTAAPAVTPAAVPAAIPVKPAEDKPAEADGEKSAKESEEPARG